MFTSENTRGNTYALKHGQRRTRLYNVWARMRYRCTNPRSSDYHCYGGRGIQVCSEWANSFVAFRDWALSSGYARGLEIDRIDVNGNYEPTNCRWVTHRVQCNNRRDNQYAEIFGERKTLSEWAFDPRCKVPRMTFSCRILHGWEGELALSWPVQDKRVEIFGEKKTLSAWARDKRCKVDFATLWHRISRAGWNPETALTSPTLY